MGELIESLVTHQTHCLLQAKSATALESVAAGLWREASQEKRPLVVEGRKKEEK